MIGGWRDQDSIVTGTLAHFQGTENSQPVFPGSSPMDPEGEPAWGSHAAARSPPVRGLLGLLQKRCLPRPLPLPQPRRTAA